MTVVVAVVAAVVVAGVYLTWVAGRIDRMHVRVEAAKAALDAQLVRRAAVAGELAALLPDAELHEAARRALESGDDRQPVEDALTRALHEAQPQLTSRGGAEFDRLRHDLEVATAKVRYARAFHNDAVRDTLTLRRRRLPRWLHLAGRAALPAYFEIDDPGAGKPDSSSAMRHEQRGRLP